MKTLVDSCVWSLLLRRRSAAPLSRDQQFVLATLREAIEDGRVAIIGPIRQEILSGVKEPAQFDKLKTALRRFKDESLATVHYEEAARLFNTCRSRGVECGPTDILICVVAVEKHWSILTYDQGLKRCIDVLRTEGIMN